MNAVCAGHLVAAMAAQARVMGMQAENLDRLSRGESVAYGAEAFNYEAEILTGLSEAIYRDSSP